MNKILFLVFLFLDPILDYDNSRGICHHKTYSITSSNIKEIALWCLMAFLSLIFIHFTLIISVDLILFLNNIIIYLKIYLFIGG